MANIYQWFKFFPSDWLMGRIQRQSDSVQVAFIRLCCKYWHKEGELSSEEAEMECGTEIYEILVNSKLIIHTSSTISIRFLDEQIADNEQFSKKQSARGKASAEAKKQAKTDSTMVNQRSTSVQPAFNHGQPVFNQNQPLENENENESNNVELPKATSTISDSVDFNKFIAWFNSAKTINGKPAQYKLTDKVKGKLKKAIKNYSSAQIAIVLKNVMKDNYHVETNFKYVTPEFITRDDIIEKYLNVQETVKPKFQYGAAN